MRRAPHRRERGGGRPGPEGLIVAAAGVAVAFILAPGLPQLPPHAGLAPPRAEAAHVTDADLPEAETAGGGLSGAVRVIDGDTLAMGERRIRLEGIDAPERSQFCERDGRPWPCGDAARTALVRRVEGRTVRCDVRGRDRYGRDLARCSVGGEDLGGWLVDQGLAQAYRRYSTDYVAQEDAARARRAGAWAGSFEAPEAWRRQGRD